MLFRLNSFKALPNKICFPNIAIAYYFIMISVNSNFRVFIPNGVWFAIELVFYILLLFSLKSIYKSFNKYHCFVVILFLLVYLPSFIFTSNKEVHYSFLDFLVRWGLPLFLLGLSVNNYNDLFNKMKGVSVLYCIFAVIGIFLLRTNASVVDSYSQNTGYQSLLPFAVFGVNFFCFKKKHSIFFIILSFAIMLIGGARGPLLAFLLCFFVEFLFLTKFSIKKITGCFALIFVILFFYEFFYEEFLNNLILVFTNGGLSTRILEGLKLGTISTDSARNQLSAFSVSYSVDHLFFGTGFINDRIILFNNLTVDTNKTVFGYYSHNILLEMCMQFGLVAGLLVFLIFAIIVIWQFRIKSTSQEKGLFVVFLSVGLFPLFVSYSYISYQYFYLLIGFLLTRFYRSKRITFKGKPSLNGDVRNSVFRLN